MDDRILVETVISKETTAPAREAAFRALVEAHQDRVFNACLGFLHNKEDAEDVAQDVFVEVYNSLPSFRGDAQLSTWIYRISVTKSLDLIRRRKRQKRFGILQSLVGLEQDGKEVASEFQHPGVLMEDKERSQVLFKHIDCLPENQRIPLVLHSIEGLSYKEISDVMNTSLSSVESLIFRARNTLKKRLYAFYKENL